MSHDPTKCMRYGCDDLRHENSVLCQPHTYEVLRGERRAPPLRNCIDYYSGARKTFLVENLSELPVYDKGENYTAPEPTEEHRRARDAMIDKLISETPRIDPEELARRRALDLREELLDWADILNAIKKTTEEP